MSTRITTGMIAAQHRCARPQPRHRAARPQRSSKVALQPRDHAARPTTRTTPRARSQLRGSLAGVAAVPAQHPGRAGLAGGHRARAVGRSPTPSSAPATCSLRGRLGLRRRRRARVDRQGDRPAHRGRQAERRTPPTSGRYVFAGTATDQPPYVDGADDAYQGAPRVVARQVGPGVSLEIGITGESVPRLRRAAADGKLLDTLRDIAGAPALGRHRRRCAAPTSSSSTRNLDDAARRARAQRRPAEPARRGARAAWPRSRRPR